MNNLIPFGAGHRACIDHNIAAVSVLKVPVTLRKEEFKIVDKDQQLLVTSVGMDEKYGPLLCKVKERQV